MVNTGSVACQGFTARYSATLEGIPPDAVPTPAVPAGLHPANGPRKVVSWNVLCAATANPAPTSSPSTLSPTTASPTLPPALIPFELKTSGHCTEHVLTVAACNEAAAALGLSDTTAENDLQSKKSFDPPGCYFEGGRLKMNTDLSNTGACSSRDKCLCVRLTHSPTFVPTNSAQYSSLTPPSSSGSCIGSTTLTGAHAMGMPADVRPAITRIFGCRLIRFYLRWAWPVPG